MSEKVIIIGAGAAGLTAAIYTARADLNPLCFIGPQTGGQLAVTNDVENFPGFPEARTGPELIDLMRQQAERFGARVVSETVSEVDVSSRPFRVATESATHEAEALIVATGASARWLGLESERKLIGRGVSACATCDGFFFRDKDVVVVGGGDTAMEEATFLTRFCAKVTVVHRRDELRASKIMADRATKNPKIAFAWNSVVEEVLDPEAGKVTGVRLRNVQTDETSEMRCDGVFMAIGHDPNTGFLKGAVETDAGGFILCKGRTSMTSIPGVFAAGDVADPRYKQAVTAAGSGCMAAIDAERFLEENE
ncbi:thioredoxin-disulfide reductase [Candidatus Sumerlaeota bacterium]|nr:thioredoxin-disulfide reductase [Candidatus Sumerlaeota bacterium]